MRSIAGAVSAKVVPRWRASTGVTGGVMPNEQLPRRAPEVQLGGNSHERLQLPQLHR
jgi:hypothetical protein